MVQSSLVLSSAKATTLTGQRSGIVLQIGFFLCLNLQDSFHVVLVGELCSSTTEGNHPLPNDTVFRESVSTTSVQSNYSMLAFTFPAYLLQRNTYRFNTHGLALGSIEIICAASQFLIVHIGADMSRRGKKKRSENMYQIEKARSRASLKPNSELSTKESTHHSAALR